MSDCISVLSHRQVRPAHQGCRHTGSTQGFPAVESTTSLRNPRDLHCSPLPAFVSQGDLFRHTCGLPHSLYPATGFLGPGFHPEWSTEVTPLMGQSRISRCNTCSHQQRVLPVAVRVPSAGDCEVQQLAPAFPQRSVLESLRPLDLLQLFKYGRSRIFMAYV